MAKKIFDSISDIEEIEIKGIKYRLEKTIEFGVQTIRNIPSGKPRMKAVYKLFDIETNDEAGKVIYYSVDSGNEIEMEYYTNEEYQGKGIATSLSKLAVNDIYDKKVTERSFENGQIIYKPCENVFLAITSDNAPSLSVAKKLNFDINQDNNGNYNANMTKDKYKALNLDDLVLPSDEPTQENVMKIIDYVRNYEKSQGLSDEEISHKYTHGDCSCLVSIVKRFLPKAKGKIFADDTAYAHHCIEVKLKPTDADYDEEECYFDINGKKYYKEMCDFLVEELGAPNKTLPVSNSSNVIHDNDTTLSITPKIKIKKAKIQEEEIKPEKTKKVLTKEQMKKVLNANNEEFLKVQLVLAGVSKSEINNLSGPGLRRKLFEHISFDSESIMITLCSGTYQLKNVLLKMGIESNSLNGLTREDLEKIYINSVGIDEVVEASKVVKEQEKVVGKSRIHRYENSLQAMRLERGKQINQEIKNMGLKTKEEKREYAKKLSAYEIEDAERFYDIDRQLAKSSQTIADIITKS